MKKTYLLLSMLLFAVWMIGRFVYHASMNVHVILLLSLLLLLQSVITDGTTKTGSMATVNEDAG